jgi:GT2 family glycosyltransferase
MLPMPEDHAPPVVAVVVASDSGPWFERSLAALAAQDYPNLTTLVVDAASSEPLASRVAAVTPGFYVSRLEHNDGFGPSANATRDVVLGATYYLFCHDDVVLDPDALRAMVDEALRSNAGIVGPKLVDADEPDRILQFGLSMDRFGAPVRRVKRRELDQAQHDEPREVFAVPGGCMLVRADLFAAVGGFDPEISMFGEDIDLSWRARIAGARVFVTPLATVRHLEATAARRRPLPEARALQWRHMLRATLKNYGPSRRTRIVVQLAGLSALEIVYFAVIGRRRRAREVIDAWRWNLAPARDLDGARAAVGATRRVPDRVVLRLAARRSSRLVRAVRSRLESAVLRWTRRHDTEGVLAADPSQTGRRPRWMTVCGLLAGLVVLVGSRLLLVGHVPLVGGYLPIPEPFHLIATYLGGTTSSGTQPTGPASPAFAILGLAGVVAAGSMGVVLKVGLVLAVVAGVWGVVRLVRPLGPGPASFAAGITYLFLPLVWDDLARGDLPALVLYGGMPWMLGRVARATRLPPYAESPAAILSWVTAEECLSLGVVVAIVASFAPAAVIDLAVVAVAQVGVTFLVRGVARGLQSLRGLVVAGGAVVVAFVLCFPWSLTFVQTGARLSAVVGVTTTGAAVPNLAALLRFDLGPIGGGPLSYAFVAAALFVLVVGTAERFAWAARYWGALLATVAVTWAAGEGWLGEGGGAARQLIVPAASCVAVLVGLGVSSMAREVSGSRLGWRQTATVGFAVVALAGLLPVLGAVWGGRWDLPEIGYDSVISATAGQRGAGSAGRELWLGAPLALPPAGWQIRPGLAEALTPNGLPDATALWPDANPGTVANVAAAVSDAELGRTVELGKLLVPSGVGVIVVPTAFAPELAGVQKAPEAAPPADLIAALSKQLDLRELPSEGGVYFFRNTAWRGSGLPVPAVPGGGTPAPWRVLGVAVALAAWLAIAYAAVTRRRRARRARRAAAAGAEAAPEPAVGASS